MFTRKNFFKLALYLLIASAVAFVLSFFVFHFVTDTGITTEFQLETQKPVLVFVLSLFATLNLTLSTISFFIGLVFTKKA